MSDIYLGEFVDDAEALTECRRMFPPPHYGRWSVKRTGSAVFLVDPPLFRYVGSAEAFPAEPAVDERSRKAGKARADLECEFALAMLTDPVLYAALQPSLSNQESTHAGLLRACVALSKAKTEVLKQFADHVVRSPKGGQFGF